MLELGQLSVRYPDWYGQFDLAVLTGSLVAIIGPSGGGKTTMLHAIAGFEQAASGRVLFAGRDLTSLPPADRPCAILFQDHNLFPHLSAFDNVALAINTGLRLKNHERSAVETALELVELAGLGARLPSQLSGGQRQRVALARALIARKPLLLLDEPFSALDPGLRKEMIATVNTLRAKHNLTVLMTLHTPQDALGFADLMVLIDDGCVVDQGTPSEMLAGGRSAVLDRFLGNVPSGR
jgi:thiamine transport system ATP-binding protein